MWNKHFRKEEENLHFAKAAENVVKVAQLTKELLDVTQQLQGVVMKLKDQRFLNASEKNYLVFLKALSIVSKSMAAIEERFNLPMHATNLHPRMVENLYCLTIEW